MSGAARTSFPAPGEAVIFQPEFVEFGGEERVILALSEALHARGKAHSVLCYRDHINLGHLACLPLPVHQLQPSGDGPVKAWALRQALERIRATGAPLPVLFNIQSALHAGLAGARHFQLRIPDTYSLLTPSEVVGLSGHARRRLRDWATGRGVRAARQLLTNTQALSHEMNQLYGRRALVHYLGGHGRVVSEVPLRHEHEVQLLSVSRLHGSKRIDWMLRALATASTTGGLPAWRLHIAGSGPQRAVLEAEAQALGIADRVVFHGFVSDAQLESLYRLAHVFLMPARQGFGLPAIEALYRRCVVVLNRESGVTEILQGTPWVTIAEPGEAGFAAAVHATLPRVLRAGVFQRPLPGLPTMDRWAGEVIDALGW